MADVFEQNLPSKTNLSVAIDGDYLRVVGSDNNSYKQLINDVAKKIIENYDSSSLAGVNQSVKATLDSLNNNMALTEWTELTTGVKYAKKAGIVFVNIEGVTASQTSGEEVIATLPSEYRPSTGTTIQFVMRKGSSFTGGWISSSSGAISYTAISESGTLAGFACFPTA